MIRKIRQIRAFYYKCQNPDGGPAGYFGDWETMVFAHKTATWGGDYSTRDPGSQDILRSQMQLGDLIVGYQTDKRRIIGISEFTHRKRDHRGISIHIRPLYRFNPPLDIHRLKHGNPVLKNSYAINFQRVAVGDFSRRELIALLVEAKVPPSDIPVDFSEGMMRRAVEPRRSKRWSPKRPDDGPEFKLSSGF